jgi:uncharacterized cofD-like protein
MQKTPRKKRGNIFETLKRELRWLSIGIGVKRWILLIIFGTTLLGLGFAVVLVDIYRTAPNTWWVPALRFIALKGLNRVLRGVIFGGIGLLCVGIGIWRLNRNLLKPFLRPGKAVVDTVSNFRKKERGPKIVALGGGNGLSNLLSGLKHHTNNLTAIVTVADDGGSSGEIRRNVGILPPGDIRNCLAALSDNEELLTQVFQYRFAADLGLNGHSLGNLLITALTEITGSFEEAVAESGRVLAIQGQVLPATLHDVKLAATVSLPGIKRDKKIDGESQIPQSDGKIKRVWLEPSDPAAFPPAVQAILNADVIVIGPGSLYTSILPNLLVPDIARAIRASKALKFYVCNVATQQGETSHYTAEDHIHTLEKHLGHRMFDIIVINNRFEGMLGNDSEWVKPEEHIDQHYHVYQANLIDKENPWRHDRTKLASAIIDLYLEKTGPLAVKE